MWKGNGIKTKKIFKLISLFIYTHTNTISIQVSGRLAVQCHKENLNE